MPGKKIIVAISILLVSLFATVSATFAYFSQKISDWDHSIASSVVTFYFNDMSFGNTITNDQINLSRGEESDLELNVKIESKVSSIILGYHLFLSLDEGETNGLAPAIECYLLGKDDYTFLGMLNEIATRDLNSDGYIFDGFLSANKDFTYYLKFVYSPAAGDEYENKDFKITATAEIRNLNPADFDYVFAYDERTLREAVTSTANKNKTIYLADSIRLKHDLEITQPISIDLFGENILPAIDMEGNEVDVSISVHYNDIDSKCGFYDSSNLEIKGSIKLPVDINVPFGFYAITCNVEDLKAPIFSLEAAAARVQSFIDSYNGKMLTTNAKYNILSGFAPYIIKKYISITAQTRFIDDIPPESVFDSESIVLGACTGKVLNIVFDRATTVSIENMFTLTSMFSVSGSNAWAGGVMVVRGNGSQAIAESFIDIVPNRIVGSLFLPARDPVSGAYISWFIPKEYHEYFDETGAFLRGGYENLASWDDITVPVGIKVSLREDQYSIIEDRIVSVSDALTAQMRTVLIYSNKQIVLQPDLEKIITLQEELNDLVDISRLFSIEIISGLDGNDYVNYENGLPSGEGYTQFELIVKRVPAKAFVNIEGVKIKFSYKLANNEIISYTLEKTITILGTESVYEVNDSASFIQAQFEDSYYSRGESNTFEVDAIIKSGVFVEYVLDPEFTSYVTIKNDVYNNVSTVEGSNVYCVRLANGLYAYFKNSGRYDSLGNEVAGGAYVELTLYDGVDKHFQYVKLSDLFAANNVYERKMQVTVLYEFVPANNITAIIRAALYEQITTTPSSDLPVGTAVGDKIYKLNDKDDPSKGIVLYKFTLLIKGILHNRADEIADFNIYQILLSHFDGTVNGRKNGYIEHDEALKAPVGVPPITVDSIEYQVISLPSKNITSIKGVEYFLEIKGLNLSSNKIIDISYLSTLTKLRYINLSTNNVSDITALKFLDELMYINLATNNISSIAPIQYLPNVTWLSVATNPNISDFSPLIGYTKLTYLYVNQSVDTHTNTTDALYYFTLIAANNISRLRIYVNNTSNPWTFTENQKAAAKALSQMIVMSQASMVLFVPKTYEFNGVNYTLHWYTPEASKLVFKTDANGIYNGEYSITVPIVEERIKISVKAFVGNPGNLQEVGSMTRSELLTLLPSTAFDSYVEYAPNQYDLAQNIIPDPVLREKLFTAFNKITDHETDISFYLNGELIETTEKYVLSNYEINTLSKTEYYFDWSGSGIRNLKGLDIFAGRFTIDSNTTTVNLRDNFIDDLSPLRNLVGIDILILGGQKYDFSKLVEINIDPVTKYFVSSKGGLTKLTQLYVYGSFDLNEYSVLKGLFEVYLANNRSVSIYLEPNVVWAPLTEFLNQVTGRMPKVYQLKDLGVYYILPDGSASFTEVVYELLPQTISIYSASLIASFSQPDSIASNGGGASVATYSYSGSVVGFNYTILTGFDQLFMSSITLRNTEGTTASYYVQLFANFNDKYILHEIASDNKYYSNERYVSAGIYYGVPLSTIFKGRSVITAVMRALSTRTSSLVSLGGYYFVTKDQLSSWTTGELYVDGTYFEGDSPLSGLELTGKTTLRFVRTAVIGDGSSLVNIENIYARNGGNFIDLQTTLPKLKILYLGVDESYSYYDNSVSIFSSQTFSFMPALETLAIAISKTINKFDWHFLSSLNSLSVATIYLFEITAGDILSKDILDIIGNIYENSAASVKNYIIQGVTFVPGESLDTLYVIEPITEYKEFSSFFSDLGVKSGNSSSNITTAEYYAATLKQEFVAGDKIYLPYSTYDMGLGVDFKENSIFNRSFYIVWYIYGVFSKTTFDSLFVVTGADVEIGDYFVKLVPMLKEGSSTEYDASYDGYIVLTCLSADYYCVIRGTVGVGYFGVKKDQSNNYSYVLTTETISKDLEGTSYNCGYPVYIMDGQNNGTGISFSEFKDLNFRLYMFIGSLSASYTASVAGLNTGGFGTSYNGKQPALQRLHLYVYNITDVAGSSISNIVFTAFNTSNTANTTHSRMGVWANFPYYIESMVGIQHFTSLRYLSWSGDYVATLPNLSSCPLITNILLYTNALTSFDFLIGCTNLTVLTTISVYQNPFVDITGIKYLPNLTSLTMYNCTTLTAERLEPLRGLTKITTLSIYNAFGLIDNGKTLDILSTMTGLTSVSLATSAAVNYAAVMDFYNMLRGVTVENNISRAIKHIDYITASAINDSLFSLQVGSYTAKIPPYVAEKVNYFKNGSELPILVSNGGTLQAMYTVKISSDSSVYTINGRECDDFDPVMWAYFARTLSISGTIISAPTSISIASYTYTSDITKQSSSYYLYSLKGLQYLPSLTTLTVYIHPVKELWAGSSSIATLTIFNAQLTEKDIYDALIDSTKIAIFNFRSTFGIDYTKEVYPGKSIASEIFTKSTIVSIGMDVTKNLKSSNARSWGEFLIQLYSDIQNPWYKNRTARLVVCYPTYQYPATSNTNYRSLTISGLYTGLTRYYTLNNYSRLNILRTYSDSAAVVTTILTTTQRFYTINNYTDTINVNRQIFSEYSLSGTTLTVGINYGDIISLTNRTLHFYLPRSISYMGRSKRADAVTYTITTTAMQNKGILSSDGEFNIRFTYENGQYLLNDNNVTGNIVFVNGIGSLTFNVTASSNYLSTGSANITTIYVIKNITETESNIDYNYYIQLENGAEPELASKYIHCPGLLYYLYETNTSLRDSSFVYAGIAKPNTITYAKRNQTALTFSLGTTATTQNIITSLNGLELFPNLESITLGTYTSIASIEPLRNHKLKTFSHYGGYFYTYNGGTIYNTNAVLMDFTPLMNSKDTMTTFRYFYYSYGGVSDLSFLINMTKLTSIYIYYSSGTSAYNYVLTSPFRYLLSAFRNKGVTTPFNSALSVDAATPAELSTALLLSMIESNKSFDYLDEYRLNIKDVSASDYYLPGLVSKGGKLHSLEWNEALGDISIDKFNTTDSDFNKLTFNNKYTVVFNSSYASESGAYYSAGENILSKAQLDKLINETNFITRYANSEISVSVKMNLTLFSDKIYKVSARLTEALTMERVLTITNN